MSLLFSSARLIESFKDKGTDSLPTPKRERLGTGGNGFAWNCGITGSRKGSFVPLGAVDPPGTLPAGGVGDGVCAGRVVTPGGRVGLVCCVPGGAVGFWVGVVVPGIGSCPGGRVGSPGAGVGRGVCCGVCASAAFAPAKTIDARTTGLTNLVDIKLNIRRRAP